MWTASSVAVFAACYGAVGTALQPPAFNATEINLTAKLAIQNLTSMPKWSAGGWGWDQGIGLYGIWKHYEATADISSFEAVESWYQTHLPAEASKNINTMAVFSTLASLYNATNNASYVPYLTEWAEWAMYNLTRTEEGGMQHYISATSPNTQQLWIDTLMMTVIPLTKIGKILNKPEYVAEAKKQWLIHIKYLFDTKAGLFMHGWTFVNRNNFAGAHWARGNAWGMITITEALELLDLPPNDPMQTALLETITAQRAALPTLQDISSGLWSTLLDVPINSGSYIETSGSAGIVFSYLKAQRKGWTNSTYDAVARKGVQGIVDMVAPNGEVRNVSQGTGMGTTLQFYLDLKKIQTMWGQGMAVMALSEALRTFSR